MYLYRYDNCRTWRLRQLEEYQPATKKAMALRPDGHESRTRIGHLQNAKRLVANLRRRMSATSVEGLEQLLGR